MKYQHKITKVIVQVEKFNGDHQLQLICENKIISGQIKKGQYLISYFAENNSAGVIVDQKIMDEDVFLKLYEPKKELLFD